MELVLEEALPVLARTPEGLRGLLWNLPEPWVRSDEGPETWSPYDIVGHLIQGERMNWLPRIEHLLHLGDSAPFPTFDREGMFGASTGRTMDELLDEFAVLRAASLDRLRALNLSRADLDRRGLHPDFGQVTLSQLVATWVAHDLGHVGQVARVMARQFSSAVGPWRAYLPVLGED